MLHEFLTANHKELIKRCSEKSSKRFAPVGVPAALDRGVPLFLQQLTDTLRAEQLTPLRLDQVIVPAPAPTKIGRAAAVHGAELLRLGFSIDQVVHDYGDVCQSVTEMAVEQSAPISVDEFRTLNRCLDNAIADAVASFGAAQQSVVDSQAESRQSRAKVLENENRRLLDIAIRSFAAIRTGKVGLVGATGTLLGHALSEMRTLQERAQPET